MKRKYYIFISLIIISTCLILYDGVLPYVIFSNESVTAINATPTVHPQKGDIVNPLKDMNFSSGEWEIYWIINRYDQNHLPSQFLKRKCFVLRDEQTMVTFQKHFNMKVTGIDVATVASFLVFYHDGKRVYDTSILITDDRTGLQTTEYGFIEPTELWLLDVFLSKFKPVYRPIVRLK